MGGIGNTFFQIFTSIAYSFQHNCDYLIPTKIENPHYEGQQVFQSKNLKYIDDTVNLSGNIYMYPEPFFHYREIPNFNFDYLILKGYWQSYRYFDFYKKEILEILELDKIDTYDVVCSIHYRSGDYNNLPNIHPKITEDYLKSAISYMWFENYKKFIVFSDNIPEIKQIISSFPMYKDLDFEYSEGKTELEDLISMASCGANIMANSSFSFFGQYINPNPDKIVTCPKLWFGVDMNHDTRDLFMPHFVLI